MTRQKRGAECYREGASLGGQSFTAFSSYAIAPFLLVISVSSFASWQLDPTISADISYSDNIYLMPAGSEEGDIALEVRPGFVARYRGPRFDADVDYSAQIVTFRENSDLNDTYHHLASRASATVVSDSLVVDAGAAIRQQVIDTARPVPTGSIAGSGNLSNEYATYVRPRWHMMLGSDAQFDLSYAAGDVRYDDESLDDSTQQAVAGSFGSVPQPERFGWAMSYKRSSVRFENRDKYEFEQTSIELGIPINVRSRFVVAGGEERNEYLLSSGEDAPDGNYWMVGIRSQRTNRYEFELLGGERVFGKTSSIRWTQHGRRWRTEAVYSEDYVTSAETRLDINYAETQLDIDPNAPESILPGPDPSGVAPDVYLRKRGQISGTLERSKTALNFRIYDESRRYQTIDGRESLKGLELDLEIRMNSLLTLNISGGHQENNLLDIGAIDKVNQLSLGVNRRFGRRTTGRVTLHRAEQSSELPSREYIENSARIGAIVSF